MEVMRRKLCPVCGSADTKEMRICPKRGGVPVCVSGCCSGCSWYHPDELSRFCRFRPNINYPEAIVAALMEIRG